jgi:signal transduction histidine kinase
LALALQIAHRHGGDISVVNEGGAVFTARIPARVAVAH